MHEQEENPKYINDGSSAFGCQKSHPDLKHSSMAGSPRCTIATLPVDSLGAMHHAPSYVDSKAEIDSHQLGFSTTIPYEYHEAAVSEQQADARLIPAAGAMSQPACYVIGQENEVLAAAVSLSPVRCHQNYPVEPYIEEVPYLTSETSTSIQSSPGTFLNASFHNPMDHNGFYTHQLTQYYASQIPQLMVFGSPEITSFYALPFDPQQEQWTRFGPPVGRITTG